MRSGFKAIIFDFEGTLVDFQWQLAPAEAQLRRACAGLGHATEGNYAELWNAAAAAARTQVQRDELRRALQPIYERFDADAATRWTPRPGAASLLAALAAEGLGAALVSNCGRAAVQAVLERHGLQGFLDPLFCRDDVSFMKPHPEGTLRALAALGLPPGQVLFVGDSRTDVRTARAAGLRVAIIRGGESREEDFAASPPDLWLDELAELRTIALRHGSTAP